MKILLEMIYYQKYIIKINFCLEFAFDITAGLENNCLFFFIKVYNKISYQTEGIFLLKNIYKIKSFSINFLLLTFFDNNMKNKDDNYTNIYRDDYLLAKKIIFIIY